MNFNEKTITSEKKFEGKIINVEILDVELPDGKKGYREIDLLFIKCQVLF